MKILMVAPRFTPNSGGGGYVVTKNLCESLSKRHDIQLWTSDYAATNDDLVRRNYIVIHFDTAFTLMGFHITPDLVKWVKLVLDEASWGTAADPKNQIDIVHLQGCRTFQNIVVSHYCRKYKIPYIVDAHGFPMQGTILHKVVLWLFDIIFANRIVRGATKCIAETEVGKKEYLRAGVKEDNIEIIPTPYDLSIFDDLSPKGSFRKRQNTPSETKIVGFLGGLDRIKGVDLLIEAIALLDSEKVMLYVAGKDMGHKKELDKIIQKHNMTNVEFLGYVSGRDKLEFLVDCDVCVFPSRAEQGLPFAALESLMCGTPIIVTDGTGSAEDVSKMGCGEICDFDANDLSVNISYSLWLGRRSTKWKMQRGKEYIRNNLSNEVQVKKYERLYDRIVDDNETLKFYIARGMWE